jgi:hypothetical protein
MGSIHNIHLEVTLLPKGRRVSIIYCTNIVFNGKIRQKVTGTYCHQFYSQSDGRFWSIRRIRIKLTKATLQKFLKIAKRDFKNFMT